MMFLISFSSLAYILRYFQTSLCWYLEGVVLPEQPDAFGQVVSCTSWGGLRMCLGGHLHLVTFRIIYVGLMSQLEDSRTSFFKFLYLLCRNWPTSHPAYIGNILNLHPGSYAFCLQLQSLYAQHEIVLFLWPTTLMSRLHVVRRSLFVLFDICTYM